MDTSLIEVEIPSLGYVILEGSKYTDSQKLDTNVDNTYAHDLEGSLVIGNEILEVRIHSNGSFSVVEKETGQVVIRSHRLEAHQDKPGDWDTWDIERSSLEMPSTQLEVVERPRVIITGQMISCAGLSLGFQGSVVKQRICVRRGSSVVEIRSRIRWRARGYMLKTWIKFPFEFDEAYYEIPFGVIKRRSRGTDSWDTAKFEAPALRWVDVSDGNKGVAIISFAKHRYSVRDNKIGLTLIKIKNPLFPNPYGDPPETIYYIYPHKGDYVEGDVVRTAYELWSPPTVLRTSRPHIEDPVTGFARLDKGSVVLEAIKRAEKGGELIIRIYEVGGRETTAKLDLWGAFEIFETDLLERITRPLSPGTKSLTVELKPHEIKSLMLRRIVWYSEKFGS